MTTSQMFLVRITYTHKLLGVAVQHTDFVVADIETAISLINENYSNISGGMVSIVDLEKTLSGQSLELHPKITAGIDLEMVHKLYAHITPTTVHLAA